MTGVAVPEERPRSALRDFVMLTKPAWGVYKYSLLYVALLFAAMVVDRGLAR